MDFTFVLLYNAIHHRKRHYVRRTKGHGTRLRFVPHNMTSSVIYYGTDKHKSEIHLLIYHIFV